MGATHTETCAGLSPQELSRSHFKYLSPMGTGAFGQIWKVQRRTTGKAYAIKEMCKAVVVFKRSVHAVMNEHTLLTKLQHPFIVNLHYAFQDSVNLYLVLDLMEANSLYYHTTVRRFSEQEAKFVIACIILGLEYIHSKGVIHRDIRPENILLDTKGYARITNFALARTWTNKNFHDTCGIPGYIAPEVVCRESHGVTVDYFAVGAIAYEFMLGHKPYEGTTRKEVKIDIIRRQAAVRKNEIPNGWSLEAADFINKCLQRTAETRLGINGVDELKNHFWLQGTNWQSLAAKTANAPYKPGPKSIEQKKDAEDVVALKMLEQIKNNDEVHKCFKGFYFDPDQAKSNS